MNSGWKKAEKKSWIFFFFFSFPELGNEVLHQGGWNWGWAGGPNGSPSKARALLQIPGPNLPAMESDISLQICLLRLPKTELPVVASLVL